MNSINERIKKIRKEFDMTQQEFADKIKVKRNTVATYEMGRSGISDAAVSLICREFNINENWLRTGEGEMKIEIPEEDLYSRAAASLLKEDDVLGIEGLKLYYSLSSESKKAVREYVLALAEKIKKHENNK